MSNQPQEQSYVDVKLLDCSRRSSIEYTSGNEANNAIFTNKLNSGIQLDVGDTINIHSAIVSERGAGGQTIELKGNHLGRVGIEHITRITPNSIKNNYKENGYDYVLNRYDSVKYETVTKFKDLKDNNVHLTVQYYKAANGENCFSLPRCNNYYQETAAWTVEDNASDGSTKFQPKNGRIVESDYGRDRNPSSRWNASWYLNREIVKVRQDGTKFTIFNRDGTTYFNSILAGREFMRYYTNGNGSLDPAVSSYKIYRELKTIEIPEGRRSADFIAETFTNSLQNASSLDKYDYWTDNPSKVDSYENQGVIAGVYKTDTYKPFNCANSNFSYNNFTLNVAEFDFDNDNRNQASQARLDWLNCFLNVGFKRPEFVDSGRHDWGNGFFYRGENYNYITKINNDAYSGRADVRLSINKEYTKENCEKLSKWIKKQELYPEFWDFRNASGLYHNRTVTNTLTLTCPQDVLAGSDGLLVGYTTEKLELTVPFLKRTITFESASVTPITGVSTVNDIFTEEDFNVQTVFWDGSVVHTIAAGTQITFTITDELPALTSDNSRFLHIDMLQAYESASKTLCSDRKEFGSDQYKQNPANLAEAIKYNTPSEPLFVTYIKEQENEFFTNPIFNTISQRLSYGLFLEDADGNIMVTCQGLGEVPRGFYNASGFFIGGEEAVVNGSYNLDKYRRHIGYDPHFTAYGNAAIGLYTPSGQIDIAENLESSIKTMNANGSTTAISDAEPIDEVINQVYLGSSNPKLTYDSTKDRFAFADFYTPEFLGNSGGAGESSDNNPVVDGKALVYKINKRLRRQNFAPGMGPYLQEKSITVNSTSKTSASQVDIQVDLPNRNIYPFSIMDCQSGIAIEKFGISEKLWDKSLMGILGFSYESVQAPISASNTMQQRVNTFNIKKLNKVTTQAEIKAEDTLIYNQNIFGAILYQPNILTSLMLHDNKHTKLYYQYTTPITVDTESLSIVGDNVPKSMLSPFFSIRSDLIDNTSAYFGSVDSGQNLPVMGIVMKNYNSGDYVYGEESSVQFTVTKSKVITSITTSITDPDGSYSRVDDSSAVVYKIQKNKSYPINLLQQLFGKK